MRRDRGLRSTLELTPDAVRGEIRRREEIELASSSLREFTRLAWPIIEPSYKYVPNWHIDAICDHLEAARRREIRRLLINIPPRHMKSLSVSVFWPAWWWIEEPWIRFLTASYGERLAIRDARKSRQLIRSDWFQDRFGDRFQMSGDQDTKGRYENTHTGYRVSTSVGGLGTGEGGDVIIIDDPHKTDEAESDVERQTVLDWYDGTISTRKNDPETGVEVLIMQRLHHNDLAGHVLNHGGWTHLCLPAEYEPKNPFTWPDDPRSEPGELLWPERFGRQALDELKATLGSYKASGQLQQNPTPREGALLKRAYWRYFDPEFMFKPERLPKFNMVVQSWDTTFKDKTTSDYVVCTVWGVRGADRYLLRVIRERMALGAVKRAIREVSASVTELWPKAARWVLVEKAANGPEVVAELKREIPGVVAVTVSTDKVARAEAAEPTLEAGNCFLPGWPSPDGGGYDPARTPAFTQAFVEECAQFNRGEYDDQVDSWSQAMNWVASRGARRAKVLVA